MPFLLTYLLRYDLQFRPDFFCKIIGWWNLADGPSIGYWNVKKCKNLPEGNRSSINEDGLIQAFIFVEGEDISQRKAFAQNTTETRNFQVDSLRQRSSYVTSRSKILWSFLYKHNLM
ncbi:hypothetical protein COW46_03665 [Candidatus Gracilibacteria bacterium CG17_big_fil_post_rev_8_21_14_2_50_48_13]|nr:MAG: hypothetical protein COW46_03665 [Candidatus Gracilibacteria bacterium CG17_big_fil_post_rev_8_21_14_2_50_48_13]